MRTLPMLEVGLLAAPFVIMGLWALDSAVALWVMVVLFVVVLAYFLSTQPMDESIGIGDVGFFTEGKVSRRRLTVHKRVL